MEFKPLPEKTLEKWARKARSGNVAYRIKYSNYWRSVWNDCSKDADSTMIHERDYQPMNCCLCGKEMNSIHDTHNPHPLAPKTIAKQALENQSPHRCCGACNAHRVCPARMLAADGKGTFYQPLEDWLEYPDVPGLVPTGDIRPYSYGTKSKKPKGFGA